PLSCVFLPLFCFFFFVWGGATHTKNFCARGGGSKNPRKTTHRGGVKKKVGIKNIKQKKKKGGWGKTKKKKN
ncbi:hypothetical protein, partial [Limosilactobacillus reuteri]|uniref:hypothetical protein n=1 Tax=Limosilactobacillus reuteri TaxID=1598 RepID=UPI001CDAFFE5